MRTKVLAQSLCLTGYTLLHTLRPGERMLSTQVESVTRIFVWRLFAASGGGFRGSGRLCLSSLVILQVAGWTGGMSFHALRRAPSIRTGARLIGVPLEPLPDDVRGHQDRLQGLHHRRGKALRLRLNRSPPAAKVCHDPWLSTLNIALFAAANVAAPSSGP